MGTNQRGRQAVCSFMMGDLAVAVVVGAVIGWLALTDARTMRVPVRTIQMLTIASIAGLTPLSDVAGSPSPSTGAAAGAMVVTAIQTLPRIVSRLRGSDLLGFAEVRLAVPFGWTLGWFSVGIAVVRLSVALVVGLSAAQLSRVAFVLVLCAGYWLTLTWAIAVSP